MTEPVAKYCKLRSTINQYDQRCRDQVSILEKERVAIREGLIAWMHKTGLDVVQLPETLDSDGAVRYRCIRIKKTTSQRTITPEKTKQAIMEMFYYQGPDADQDIPISSSVVPSLAPHSSPPHELVFHERTDRLSETNSSGKKDAEQVRETNIKSGDAAAAEMAYTLIKNSCTVHNENINVTESKRRPAYIPLEQKKLQAKMLSVDDLAKLNALAETYRQRNAAISERRKHYCDAKKITREQMVACEPGVQQYLQSLPPRQLNSKKNPQATAIATQQVVLHTPSSSSDKKENHYVIALQKKCDPTHNIMKPPPRLTFTALKKIVDYTIRRRADKLAAAGIIYMKKKDWYRTVATDVLAAVEDYYTTADAKRKKRKLLLDAAPKTSTAVVMRKMPIKRNAQSNRSNARTPSSSSSSYTSSSHHRISQFK